MDLGRRTSPSVPGTVTLLVPLGAVEQHGPHLPLDADTTVADAVCRGVAERFAADGRTVLVAPALPYGASGEHEGFPGTVSIGTEALRTVVVELVRSARRWCGPVVLVTGHGGNADAVSAAVRRLRHEGHDVAWTSCAEPDWDAHAGRAETSLLLALRPADVETAAAVAGPLAPVADLMPALREGGVRAVSPSGVLGDPAGATPDEGHEHLRRLVDRVHGQLVAGLVDEHGRLERPVPARTSR